MHRYLGLLYTHDIIMFPHEVLMVLSPWKSTCVGVKKRLQKKYFVTKFVQADAVF